MGSIKKYIFKRKGEEVIEPLIQNSTFNQAIAVDENKSSAFAWGRNGDFFYIVDDVKELIKQYSLSTPYDITGKTFVGQVDLSYIATNPEEIAFNPDGTKLFYMALDTDKVHELHLSTAWSVATISNPNKTLDLSVAAPYGMDFSEDGTMLFMCDSGDYIYQYNLTEPWDITTGSLFHSVDLELTLNIGDPRAMYIAPGGRRIFFLSSTSDRVHEAKMDSPYDINSLTILNTFYIGTQAANPNGLIFTPDLSQFIIGLYDYAAKSIFLYDTNN